MNFLRLILLPTLLALLLMGRADAGSSCGPGGGMMGGPPPQVMGPSPGAGGPGSGWAGALGSMMFGTCGPPAGGAAASTGLVINLLNNYLRSQPDLRAGRLTARGGYWEAEILDSQGNLVNKLRIDPRNGCFYYQK
jgi:hypothetical protein